MSRSVAVIIASAGGVEAVAAKAGLGKSAVEKWRRNGVPDAHWPIFVEAGIATPEELYAANLAARGEGASPAATSEAAHA